jgi:hypothetical protein
MLLKGEHAFATADCKLSSLPQSKYSRRNSPHGSVSHLQIALGSRIITDLFGRGDRVWGTGANYFLQARAIFSLTSGLMPDLRSSLDLK